MQRISASDGKDITIEYLYPYVVLTLKETFTAKSNGVFAQSTPSVTKIRNLHSWARRRAYPPLSYGSPPRGWNWQIVGASQKMMTAAAINAPLCSLCFRWKKKAPMPSGQKDPQSLCVVYVIFLLCTKVNRMKMCMFSFNRVQLQSLTSSLAWLFWERSAFLSASYSSSWSWNRDIQELILGKKILNFTEC